MTSDWTTTSQWIMTSDLITELDCDFYLGSQLFPCCLLTWHVLMKPEAIWRGPAARNWERPVANTPQRAETLSPTAFHGTEFCQQPCGVGITSFPSRVFRWDSSQANTSIQLVRHPEQRSWLNYVRTPWPTETESCDVSSCYILW